MLLKPLLSVASEDWSNKAEFRILRHLANERLSRELHWNAECLWRQIDNAESEYFSLIRTDAFDALVASNVPIDLLLANPVRADWLETEQYASI